MLHQRLLLIVVLVVILVLLNAFLASCFVGLLLLRLPVLGCQNRHLGALVLVINGPVERLRESPADEFRENGQLFRLEPAAECEVCLLPAVDQVGKRLARRVAVIAHQVPLHLVRPTVGSDALAAEMASRQHGLDRRAVANLCAPLISVTCAAALKLVEHYKA